MPLETLQTVKGFAMKVYSVPAEVPAPEIDWANFDYDKLVREHKERLKTYLQKVGFTGRNTGKVISFHVADGYAYYMMAEGRKSFLIHLPYGDAYQYPDVQFLPKKEILRRIKQEEEMRKIFSSRAR